MNAKLLLITDRIDHTQLQKLEISILNYVAPADTPSAADLATYDLILIHFQGDTNHAVAICRELRLGYEEPILLLSHEHDDRYLQRAYEAGVDDYLEQPASLHLLLAKIEAWLRCRRVYAVRLR